MTEARYWQERNRLRFAFRFGDRATVMRALWLSVRRLAVEPAARTCPRVWPSALWLAPAALLARRAARRA